MALTGALRAIADRSLMGYKHLRSLNLKLVIWGIIALSGVVMLL